MRIDKEKKYIVRSVEAGVFFGKIEEKDGNEVTMSNARCLWSWEGAASLNQLASEGAKRPRECRFTMPLESVTILNVCEIIPCTPAAVSNIEEVPIWKV